jgi:hypothetical protein
MVKAWLARLPFGFQSFEGQTSQQVLESGANAGGIFLERGKSGSFDGRVDDV